MPPALARRELGTVQPPADGEVLAPPDGIRIKHRQDALQAAAHSGGTRFSPCRAQLHDRSDPVPFTLPSPLPRLRYLVALLAVGAL
ncbi:MAG TPA: hypothetical protein VFK09_13210, partial [Gemmatimonadales bacterium]|nr:hypothetical protein [Gemmatimonadales bacterium]